MQNWFRDKTKMPLHRKNNSNIHERTPKRVGKHKKDRSMMEIKMSP